MEDKIVISRQPAGREGEELYGALDGQNIRISVGDFHDGYSIDLTPNDVERLAAWLTEAAAKARAA